MNEPPTYDEILADNITAARARRRLSQRAVAARMAALGFGWRQQIVAAAESGRRRLTASEVLGLAYALETSIGVLMGPSPDGERIALPSGHTIDAASAEWSLRAFNDGTIQWNGDIPEFREIPLSRRDQLVLDASIGPMARYGRYRPDRHTLAKWPDHAPGPGDFLSKPPTAEDLDNWREWEGSSESRRGQEWSKGDET